MASPQIENGFTKIANEILEVIAKTKFNGTQFRILMIVWRYTYGFNRKSHGFSLTFLSEATECHKQQLKKELDRLIKNNVLLVYGEASFSKPREIGFNKNYEDWELKQSQSTNKCTVSKSTDATVSENAYTTVSKSTDATVSEFTDQEINNINKNINKTTTSSLYSSEDEVTSTSEIIIDKEFAQLAQAYQKYIGIPDGYTPTWLENILEEFGLKWCENAMREANERGKRNKKYVKGILDNWKRNGGMKLRKDVSDGKYQGDNNKNGNGPGPSEETLRLEKIAKEKGLIGPNGEVELGEIDF